MDRRIDVVVRNLDFRLETRCQRKAIICIRHAHMYHCLGVDDLTCVRTGVSVYVFAIFISFIRD